MLHKTALASLLLTLVCATFSPAATARTGTHALVADEPSQTCEAGALTPTAGEDVEPKRRPRAEPLPDPEARPQRERRRQRPHPRDGDDEGPIGCPDRNQKLELIVRLDAAAAWLRGTAGLQ